ncbi:hypothetical protein CEXT_202941 [Caerostris extrusa]|uniref:non-specific serine/threonine protein kinase n=1 Tax=Caerostris extrusa TaxID=172846 RepID=A0AAV4VER5_CAEEX|nr:hypothetical protein CEXT_202941 [Caerostris extrusa]
MVRIKCYGRVKTAVIDPSPKRKFFAENDSFQACVLQEEKSSSYCNDVRADHFLELSDTIQMDNLCCSLRSGKVKSKQSKCTRSYKKRMLKYNLNSSLLQCECSNNCQYSPPAKKKLAKKKKRKPIGKNSQSTKKGLENVDKIKELSLNSKSDSFWAAMQPRWSSIYEHSLVIEKIENIEHLTNYDYESSLIAKKSAKNNKTSVDFELNKENQYSGKLLNPDVCNMSKTLSTNEVACRSTSFIDLGGSEVVPKNFENKISSQNVNASKIAVASVKNNRSSRGNLHKSREIHSKDKENLIISDQHKNVYDKLEISEVKKVAFLNDFSFSHATCKNLESDKIVTESRNANETLSSIAGMDKSKKKDRLSARTSESFSECVPSFFREKNKELFSSTPLSSPAPFHCVKAKMPKSDTSFNHSVQKIFTSCSPIITVKQKTEMSHQYDLSKISSSGHFYNSLRDQSAEFLTKQSRFLSVSSFKNLSISQRKNKTHSSLSHKIVKSKGNSCHQLSRSCESVSEAWKKFPFAAISYNSFAMAVQTSLSDCIKETGFEFTLTKLLEFCDQTAVIPFKEIYDWRHITIRKIGEGSYGEVFSLVQNKLSSVVKIVPFSEDSSNHDLLSIESVLSEIKVSRCLSELRNNKSNKTKNFNNLKSVRIVKGCYPEKMLSAWDKFNAEITSYNLRPDVFNEQQFFAIIELEYGGKDLSCFVLRNAAEAESILKQIAISLAIAEEVHSFEHRDLHLGNILVERNKSKSISYVLRGQTFFIPSNGIVVTIIDFTLSRILDNGCIFYNDLAADESLFNQNGDAQFEVYRATRNHLNNEWHNCLLYSNVLWLIFLCMKFQEHEYSRSSSKKHLESLKNIELFKQNLQPCKSAFDALTACNICTSIPGNGHNSKRKQTMKGKLIDRKSFQKSTSNLTASVI